jgi:exonuclease III
MSQHKLLNGSVQALLDGFDVILLTETHALTNDAAVSLQMYGLSKAFHCARSSDFRGRGGVSAYVRASLANHVELACCRQVSGCESVWFRVAAGALCLGGSSLLVGAVYASPHDSTEYHRHEVNRMLPSEVAHIVFHDTLGAAIAAYQQPTDVLMLAGDFNARIHNLIEAPDPEAIALLSDLGDLMGGSVIGGAGGALAVGTVPPRQSMDTSANAFGRALIDLAGAADLLVLNGRVQGDVAGELTYHAPAGKGGSMIDLFLAGPELLGRARQLRVLGDMFVSGTGLSRRVRISDHRPVALELDVLRPSSDMGASTSRGARLRFDVSRWREYAERFDRRTREALAALQAELLAGTATTSEVLAGVCEIADRVFKGARKAQRQAASGEETRGTDASWWTPQCAAARLALMGFMAQAPRAPGGNLLLNEHERSVRKALRAAYARAKWEARHEQQAKEAESFVLKQQRDPWAIFRQVLGLPVAPCVLSDLGVWHAYGTELFAADPAAPLGSEPDVHRILNLINSVPGGRPYNSFDVAPSDPNIWLASSAVGARTMSANELNVAISGCF